MTTRFVSSSAGRRFRRTWFPSSPGAFRANASRGSAILLAVVLLVLLAIMGVAFISSARSERVVSASATHAVQGDLLVRAALGLVESALVNDVIDDRNGKRTLRPATADGEAEVRYDHFDGATGTGADDFLAERFPTRRGGGANDPVVWPAISAPIATASSFEDPTRLFGTHTFTDREDLEPTTVTYGGKQWPALQAGTGPGAQRYLAADTDGDGIADAALAPLGVRHDGITFYAAVRIVDNNAALNASVAWRRHDELSPTKRTPGTSLFPTHVDLESLLSRGEIDNLSAYRFGGLTSGDRNRLDPAAVWMGYARYVHDDDTGSGVGASAFRMLPASDALALAQDPLGLTAHAASFLGTLLPATLRTRPGGAYAPGDAGRWYEENYNFNSPDVSRRPLLVASNALSNVVPTRDVPKKLATLFGVPEKVVAAPTDVNTAEFNVLWYSYWNMMSGAEGKTPFDVAAVAEAKKLGTDIEGAETPVDPYSPANPQRMFRSPLREVRYDDYTRVLSAGDEKREPVRLPPFQVLLLRAAMAAVNAIDLRDVDDDVTSRRITLAGIVGGTERTVNVDIFGNERQPFITEVFVHGNTKTPGPTGEVNRNGYIAVELHNPFPKDMTLAKWQLGVIKRGGASGNSVSELVPLTGENGFDAVIPAYGHLIIENYSPDAAGAARFRPSSSGLPAITAIAHAPSVFVQNLHEVLSDGGGELVLMRPSSSSGGARIEEMAPVDQYDFTGMKLQDAPNKPFSMYYYTRANAPGVDAWKFVFPGRYDGRLRAKRQDGTVDVEITDLAGDPSPQVRLGRADPKGTYTNPFPGVPLAQQPSPVDNPHTKGGFARAGDALAVPFIGSYVVRQPGAGYRTVLEMNAVTMDAAFADDLDAQTDKYEQLGRFVPIPRISTPGGPKTPREPIRWRPERSAGHGAEVKFENFYIANIIDRDAVQIQGYDDRPKSQNWYAPGHVILRNFEVGYTERSPKGAAEKLHVDHIQITIGRDRQQIKTDVTVENGYIHSGNADTLLIQDGKYGTIRIKNLKVGPGLASVKLTIEKGGSIDKIVIEDCPGLSVAVTGAKGTELQGGNIGPVEVINSPGAVIKPQKGQNGKTVKLNITYPSGSSPPATLDQLAVDDFKANPALWRYGWATDFFDHFTALPAGGADAEEDGGSGSGAAGGASGTKSPAKPSRVEGLININTAPWPVLMALPMFEEPLSGSIKAREKQREATRKLALAIVAERQGEPYRSLRDLNRIEETFKYETDLLNAELKDPTPSMSVDPDDRQAVADAMAELKAWKARQGDLTPDDGMTDDFARQSLLLSRIGNLITTRSDSFTCYLTLQGWRNAAHQGGEPELVLERREVYVLDRSTVTPEKPRVKIMSSKMH